MNPAGAPDVLDAIILAGGRAERLGGVSKPDLVVGGRSLLATAIEAARAAGCARIVVVGPPELDAPGCTVVREDPPFGGPVAAVAAGLSAVPSAGRIAPGEAGALPSAGRVAPGEAGALPSAGRVAPGEAGRVSRPGDILVLACDMPDAPDAVRRLHAARAGGGTADGVCLVDADGRLQWLAAIYSRSSLERAFGELDAESGVAGASMRRLAASLDLTLVADGGSTHDIDTWSDLERARSTEQEAAQ
jgi:molybdopterin-guanine dinucleotide biosynthesis protein A